MSTDVATPTFEQVDSRGPRFTATVTATVLFYRAGGFDVQCARRHCHSGRAVAGIRDRRGVGPVGIPTVLPTANWLRRGWARRPSAKGYRRLDSPS